MSRSGAAGTPRPITGQRPRRVPVAKTYWDVAGILGARLYDYTLAPFAHVVAQRVLGIGAVLYGGNFAVRRRA